MKTYNNLWEKVYSYENLSLAFQKARKRKTRLPYVLEFEKHLEMNLLDLQFELRNQFYKPKPLTTFPLRDPKTRVISKSDFRDRVVHHAIVNILEPIYEKYFICDSYANRKGKGTLKALNRFDYFKNIVSKNNTKNLFVLKADVKHYFQEVNHEILVKIIKRKIKDEKILWLIKLIIKNNYRLEEKGMPLGNLTSQFFANIYLNELDYFIKRKLQIKYYIRYVDDFVILHNSQEQLEKLKEEINNFLKEKLKLELHPEKSSVIPIKRGIDFIGFRNFPNHKLLRKRNIRKIFNKIESYKNGEITFTNIYDSYQGWKGYAKCGNTYKLRNKIKIKVINELWNKI